MLLGAVQMMVYIGQPKVAEKIHNAWLKTLEDGLHTYDLYQEGTSKQKVGTKEFAQAVIARLGSKPEKLNAVQYAGNDNKKIQGSFAPTKPAKKELVGIDIFLHWNGENRNAEVLGNALKKFSAGPLELAIITNRGVKVYPEGLPETFCTDHWRCRFTSKAMDQPTNYGEAIKLMQQIQSAGYDIIKTENLYRFDGKIAFSLGQGQ